MDLSNPIDSSDDTSKVETYHSIVTFYPYSNWHQPITSPLMVLEKLIEESDIIKILSESGEICGTVPIIKLKFLNWTKGLTDSAFSDAITKTKSVRLLDGYNKERTMFFCDVMRKLGTTDLNFDAKELVWFCALADDYMMEKQVSDFFLEKISNDIVGWSIVSEIAKLRTHNDLGYVLASLFSKAKSNVTLKYIGLDSIPGECFTFARSRQLICSCLKTEEFNNETSIAIDLIDKIISISEVENTKLSIKAIYDLIACIKWFYVKYDTAISKFADLKSVYPEFSLPDKVLTALNYRKTLVANYKSKIPGVFKYNPDKIGKSVIPRISCSYTSMFTTHTKMHMYSTTNEPISIYFDIDVSKKKARRGRRGGYDLPTTFVGQTFIIIKQSSHDEIDPTKSICAKFTIKNVTTNTEIASKTWTFKKNFKFPVNETAINDQIAVSFSMVYFVDASIELPKKPKANIETYSGHTNVYASGSGFFAF